MKNLKRDKGEDAAKGQAVKNQKVLLYATVCDVVLLEITFVEVQMCIHYIDEVNLQ